MRFICPPRRTVERRSLSAFPTPGAAASDAPRYDASSRVEVPKFEALSVPPDALEKGGHEVFCAAVVDGGVSVALRRSFDEPFTWGVLLIDLARHAARIYAMETDLSEEDALAEITAGIQAELDDPTDPGSTQAIN